MNPLCMVVGCDQRSSWRLGARLWALGDTARDPKTSLELFTSLYVCNHHKEHPINTIGEFFTPEGREIIVGQLMKIGKAPPDFDSGEYMFKALDEPLPGPL